MASSSWCEATQESRTVHVVLSAHYNLPPGPAPTLITLMSEGALHGYQHLHACYACTPQPHTSPCPLQPSAPSPRPCHHLVPANEPESTAWLPATVRHHNFPTHFQTLPLPRPACTQPSPASPALPPIRLCSHLDHADERGSAAWLPAPASSSAQLRPALHRSPLPKVCLVAWRLKPLGAAVALAPQAALYRTGYIYRMGGCQPPESTQVGQRGQGC